MGREFRPRFDSSWEDHDKASAEDVSATPSLPHLYFQRAPGASPCPLTSQHVVSSVSGSLFSLLTGTWPLCHAEACQSTRWALRPAYLHTTQTPGAANSTHLPHIPHSTPPVPSFFSALPSSILPPHAFPAQTRLSVAPGTGPPISPSSVWISDSEYAPRIASGTALS